MRVRGKVVGLAALVAGMLALPVTASQAAPPPPDAGCGSSAPSLSPDTPDEQTLVSYFEALNARNYGAAWEFFGDEIRSMYRSQQNYVVSGVDVTSVANAARGADRFTPWRSGDGLWDIGLRPLLPDKHSCADVIG